MYKPYGVPRQTEGQTPWKQAKKANHSEEISDYNLTRQAPEDERQNTKKH